MSRRAPNPAADRAAQNAQTIKTLLKLETNKSCADCKRNKHPRWASWNLGVFVCIRCSGIHRGMGTHISRVKSVDLDAWTDEQMQSVLRWGNARANKYWEAKLAVGHVPSEAKIENFIRTKYESKRWVMDGPMPDPATLDADCDDDMPLNVVQEKARLDRSTSQRVSSTSSQPVPPSRAASNVDLFGDNTPIPPARPNTTDTPGTRPPPIKAAAPPKPTRPGDSLLGLDFFGGPPSAPISRSASGASNTAASNGPSRPDLKQSILSLYASAPRPQSQPQHNRQPSFNGTQAPPPSQQSNFSDLDDAFSGLSFASATAPPAPQTQAQPKSASFASFGNLASQRSAVAAPQVTSPLVSPPSSGGGFFDTSPKPPPKPAAAPRSVLQAPQAQILSSGFGDSFGDGFGDFTSAPSTKSSSVKPTLGPSSSTILENSKPVPAPISSNPPASSLDLTSAFNLSAPAPKLSTSKPPPTVRSTPAALSNFSTADAWGSNDAWANPDPSPVASKTTLAKAPSLPLPSANDFGGWGGASTSISGLGSGNGGSGAHAAPKVAADEDFGGWNSAAPVSPPAKATSGPKPGGGFGGSDDLFSNVWE